MMKLRSEYPHLIFLDDPSWKKDTPNDLKMLTEEKLRAYLTENQATSNLPTETSLLGIGSVFKSSARTNLDTLEHGLATIVRNWLREIVKARIDLEGPKPASQGSMNTIPSTWTLILNWIKSKLMLYDIPTTHLFPDPAVLQDECVRMFCVEQSWLDAFMGGTLSPANHATFPGDPSKEKSKEASTDIYGHLSQNLNQKERHPHARVLYSGARSFEPFHI